MKMIKTLFTVTFAVIAFSINAQKINPNWKTELANSVETFKKCTQTTENGVNPCSKFIGESVNTVYGINDFYSDKLGRYLTAAEIIDFLEKGVQWKKLGNALTQDVLDEAQKYANASKAVVAVYMGEDNLGNVAIILPGEVAPSGSWGLSVPNSASYFMNSKSRSYSDKGLSYAFTKNMKDKVIFYGRNY